MKKIFKKNQLIITGLALMIAGSRLSQLQQHRFKERYEGNGKQKRSKRRI